MGAVGAVLTRKGNFFRDYRDFLGFACGMVLFHFFCLYVALSCAVGSGLGLGPFAGRLAVTAGLRARNFCVCRSGKFSQSGQKLLGIACMMVLFRFFRLRVALLGPVGWGLGLGPFASDLRFCRSGKFFHIYQSLDLDLSQKGESCWVQVGLEVQVGVSGLRVVLWLNSAAYVSEVVWAARTRKRKFWVFL